MTKTSKDWYEEGRTLFNQGRFEEALTAFEQAIKLDTAFAMPWNGKGVALDDLGRFEEALKAYDQAIALDPTDAKTWSNKGVALDDLGRFEEALKAYDQAIALDPTDAKTWSNKGVALDDLGRFEEALAAYDQAIELDTAFAMPWYNKGVALKNLGRFEEALAAYDQAIALDPTDALAWNGKGNALDDLGRFEEALRAYKKAIELDETLAEPRNGKGNALKNLGRFEEALAAYDQAIALDPTDAKTWSNKGLALQDLGRFEKALRAYKQAIALDETFAAPWDGKGNALKNLGRFEEALKAYDQAIALDETFAAPWDGKGDALQELGRLEEARRARKRLCALATPKEVLRNPGRLLNVFHESPPPAPLILLRLAASTPGLLVKSGWFEAVRAVREAYAAPLACLEYLASTATDTPDRSRLRAAGCLAFHLGDPMSAEGWFDDLDDHFPEDLLGQYYLLSSGHAYWADISACQADALEAAEPYRGDDPEQHYYAARIFAFAGQDLAMSRALQNAGDYTPALLLRFDVAREQGETQTLVDLAKRILDQERAARPDRRVLSPAMFPDLDVFGQDWLADVVHFSKQLELAEEITAFLRQLDDPAFFELRHTDVLLNTQRGAYDLKVAWNLNAKSLEFVNALLADRDAAVLDKTRKQLKAAGIDVEFFENLPVDELEDLLAGNLEFEDAAHDRQRLLNLYLFQTNRLSFRASLTLLLYSLAKKGEESPEAVRGTLFDVSLYIASSAAVTSLTGNGVFLLGMTIPTPYATLLGGAALTGIVSWVCRYGAFSKKMKLEEAKRGLDYQTFREDLPAFLKKEGLELPEAFWAPSSS